jgi:hypothetical protein
MTSCLISYPDIPARAISVTTNRTYATDNSHENLLYGHRHNIAQLSSNQSNISIVYDLGSATTAAVDHLILGNAKALHALGVTDAYIQGSTNGSTWVDQMGTVSFQNRTFSGHYLKDIAFTAAFNDDRAGTLIAYRYWQLYLSGGSAHKFPLSKAYFGTFFDMGVEPSTPLYEYKEREYDAWRHGRGHVMMTKGTNSSFMFTMDWQGVTDAKAEEFCEKILENPLHHHVFLYGVTHVDPLADLKLVHCKVLADRCTIRARKKLISGGWNDITCVFEEMV